MIKHALRIGFEISEAAQSPVQLRRPVAGPRGEARSDLQIIFALAPRLGLGEHFRNGDLESAFRHQLAPEQLAVGAAARRARGRPGTAHHPLPQVRRVREWRTAWLRHAVAEDRALFRGAPGSWLPAAACVRRAAHKSTLAARPGRPIPADSHVREVAVVLPALFVQTLASLFEQSKSGPREPLIELRC